MEIEFQQSYIDPAQSIMTFGPKKIKVEKDFKYVIEKDYTAKLTYIKDNDFKN